MGVYIDVDVHTRLVGELPFKSTQFIYTSVISVTPPRSNIPLRTQYHSSTHQPIHSDHILPSRAIAVLLDEMAAEIGS